MKTLFFTITLSLLFNLAAFTKPLKVFILAGQSNMEGTADVRTFDHIGDDPKTKALLESMRKSDGTIVERDDVWISYITGEKNSHFTIAGKLTAGYGSLHGVDKTKPGKKIGPEFTFGITMGEYFDEPVLLIKTAWGGKSLHTDFRPPSAGKYEFTDFQKLLLSNKEKAGKKVDRDAIRKEKDAATGKYYSLMMEHIKEVLKDPKKVYPDYNSKDGYELSGFVWFQGFNDMVDSRAYPNSNKPDRYAEYSRLLSHLIRDVRTELKSPKLPVVIGVMGLDGMDNTNKSHLLFRNAMEAPTKTPEFKDTTAAVQTSLYWPLDLAAVASKRYKAKDKRHFLFTKHKNHENKDGKMSEEQIKAFVKKYEAELLTDEDRALWERGKSHAHFHYFGSSKFFALAGQAFAKSNLKLLKR